MDTPLAQSLRSAPDRPALAFSDPESALRWAKTLPFLNVAQVYEQVIGQLRALSAAEFTPWTRDMRSLICSVVSVSTRF